MSERENLSCFFFDFRIVIKSRFWTLSLSWLDLFEKKDAKYIISSSFSINLQKVVIVVICWFMINTETKMNYFLSSDLIILLSIWQVFFGLIDNNNKCDICRQVWNVMNSKRWPCFLLMMKIVQGTILFLDDNLNDNCMILLFWLIVFDDYNII